MESNSYQNWPTWEEIIDRSPLTVTPDTLILEAIDLMSREEDRSCVLVVDGTKLTGIFTERDVVKLTASGIDLSRTKISQAMVQPTISLTLDRNQNPLTALSFMRQHRIRNLPVVDDRDELVGLVTQERIYEAIELLERVEESGDRQKREIEQQFASLVENNPDIIFRLDLQLRHIYISPKVREASGLSPQDFLGKTGRELGLPADACDIFETACREAIATGEITRVEYAIADRQYVSRLIPERGIDGAIESIVGITEDISKRAQLEADRQQLELSLQISEGKLREILNSAIATISSFRVWDNRDWSYEYWSGGCEALFGYTVQELMIDKTLWMSRVDAFGESLIAAYRSGRTVVQPDVSADPSLSADRQAAYTAIEIAAHIGIPLIKDGELVAGLAVHANRSRFWTQEEVTLAEEVAERTWAAVERARAEATLRENEQKLSLFVKHAPVSVAMFDRDMNYLVVSQRWVDLYHLGAIETVVGRSHYELIPTIPDRWRQVHQQG